MNQQLVGIVTSRDFRFETNLDQPVANIMTPKERLVTVKEGADREIVRNYCINIVLKKYWW